MNPIRFFTRTARGLAAAAGLLLTTAAAQAQAAADLVIDAGSLVFEEGAYQGGDVIRRMQLTVRNISTDPDSFSVAFRVRVNLSRDGEYEGVDAPVDQRDDIFLNVLGGGGLGPGRAQTIRWDQYVPYNVQGEFFVVATVEPVTPDDPNLGNNNYQPTGGARITIVPTRAFEVGLISRSGVAATSSSANGQSTNPQMSVDGRYIVFESTATNIPVTNGSDANQRRDIFVYDRVTETYRCISRSSINAEANGDSWRPSISADGSLVVFHSDATNLVPGDTNNVSDIFVHDLRNGQTVRVSEPDAEMLQFSSGNVQGNGPSFNASISSSPAGIFIAFESDSTNLTRRGPGGAVLPDTNRTTDIFLHDYETRRTIRINVGFDSAGGLIEARNSNPLRNAASYGPRLSRDGRSVVYRTEADNLVSGDTNGFSDVLIYQRSVDGRAALDEPGNIATVRVNVNVDGSTGQSVQALRNPALGGAFPDRGSSYFPDLSDNGRFVVFASEASNLAGTPATVELTYGTYSRRLITVLGPPVAEVDNVPPATLEVSDGQGGRIVYEFDLDGEVGSTGPAGAQTPNEPITVGGTPAATAANIARAINGVPAGRLNVVAFAVGDQVEVVHLAPGPIGINLNPNSIAAPSLDVGPLAPGVRDFAIGDELEVSDGADSLVFRFVQGEAAPVPGRILVQIGLDASGTRDNLTRAINATALQLTANVTGGTGIGEPQSIRLVRRAAGVAPAAFLTGTRLLPGALVPDLVLVETVSPGSAESSNGAANIFVHDRDADGNGRYDEVGLVTTDSRTAPGRSTLLISRSPAGELGANGTAPGSPTYVRPDSLEATISSDGRYVVYRSLASNLLPDSLRRSDGAIVFAPILQYSDTNLSEDIIVHDRDPDENGILDDIDTRPARFSNPVNARLSINRFGFQTLFLIGSPSIPASRNAAVTPDGRFIVFTSLAESTAGLAFLDTNLKPLDNNGQTDIFFHDRRFIVDPVGDAQPPLVSIVSPVIGNTFAAGSSVVITASASDPSPNGLIRNVRFFVNGEVLGDFDAGISDPSSGRYSRVWEVPSTTGSFNLFADAIDNDGNVTRSAQVLVRVTPQIGSRPVFNPDTVVVSRSEIPLGASVNLSASVTDPDGTISRVDFFANGQLVPNGSLARPPFTVTWTPELLGSYDLRAIATDNSGNVVTTSQTSILAVRSNRPPTSALTSPPVDTTVRIGSILTLGATVSDADGRVTRVEFFANNASIAVVTDPASEIVSATWQPTAPGAFVVTAVATDDLGATSTDSGSRTVTVTAPVGAQPTVSITGLAGSTSGGGSDTGAGFTSVSSTYVLASAFDSDGSITGVDFTVDGQLLGSGTRLGTSSIWRSPLLSFSSRGPGTYSVQANARDSDDNQARSATVNVAVRTSIAGGPVVPAVNIQPSVVRAGESSTFTLQPVAAVGTTIQSVEYFANGISVGSSTTAPYTVAFAPTASGDYGIYAVVADAAGNRAVSPSGLLSASAAPPVGVAVLAPLGGQSIPVGSTVSLVARADSGNNPVNRVIFAVNGQVIGTVTAPLAAGTLLYGTTWVPTVAGPAQITATAVDGQGNSAISSAVTVNVGTLAGTTALPRVNVVSPASGSTVTNTSTLVAAAAVTLTAGSLNSVDFTLTSLTGERTTVGIDTTAPYTAPFGPLVAGTYFLSAAATDGNGNRVVSAPVVFSVVNGNQAPTVAITAPVRPATFRVTVANGAVTGVTVVDGGEGYVGAPRISFVGPTGIGATARASVDASTGRVTAVQVLTGGSSYASTTRAVPAGGFLDIQLSARNFRPARAVAVLENPLLLSPIASLLVVDAGLGYSSAPDVTVIDPQGFGRNAVFTSTIDGQGRVTGFTRIAGGDSYFTADVILTGGQDLGGFQFTVGATGLGGAIRTVELQANGERVELLTAPPYVFTWRPTDTGPYQLAAVATDSVGNVTTSSPVDLNLFAGLPPGLDPVGSNRDYVIQATNDLLRRAPSQVEIRSFTSALDARTKSRGGVLDDLRSTADFVRLADAARLAFTVLGTWPSYERLVDFANQLQEESESALAESLIISPEYTARYGPVPDLTTSAGTQQFNNVRTFVSRIYLNVLGRNPTDGEVVGANTQIQQSRGNYVALFVRQFGSELANQPAAAATLTAFTRQPASLERVRALAAQNSDQQVATLQSDASYLERFPQPPQITSISPPVEVAVGATVSLRVTVAGTGPFTYQWRFNGAPIPGANLADLTLANVTAERAGLYSVVVTNSSGLSSTESTQVAVRSTSGGRLVNLSTRGHVGTGEGALVPGFVVEGQAPRTYLIRAVGPGLAGFGVAGTLARPQLTLNRGSQALVSNTQWAQAANALELAATAGRVGAFPLSETSQDAAVLITLQPGAYTAVVQGVGGTTGEALVEVYEVEPGGTGRLVNLATRGWVDAERSMISGFVVAEGGKRVLVRAVGPGLAQYGVSGVLGSPKLTILSGQTTVAAGTSWSASSDRDAVRAAAQQVGAFALADGSTDAALVLSLPAGVYSAVVQPANGGAGVALVEVYELP